jgi:hypothetical protein
MQDNATEHTTNWYMDVLDDVFGERVINRGLWPLKLPDLKSCVSFSFFGHSARKAIRG